MGDLAEECKALFVGYCKLRALETDRKIREHYATEAWRVIDTYLDLKAIQTL